MLQFIIKIFQIVPLLIVNGFGLIQVVIKAVKEVLTAIVNLLFPLFPDGGKFEKFVLSVRAWVDGFDTAVENVKQTILSLLGLAAKA